MVKIEEKTPFSPMYKTSKNVLFKTAAVHKTFLCFVEYKAFYKYVCTQEIYLYNWIIVVYLVRIFFYRNTTTLDYSGPLLCFAYIWEPCNDDDYGCSLIFAVFNDCIIYSN